MATSKSGDRGHGWIAGAFLYSGRPDPTWSVSKRIVNRSQELWESLPIADEKSGPKPAALGYRGSFLRGPSKREWIAFNGVVSLKTPAGIQVRKDVAKEFEKTLLSSAPKGLLPEGVLAGRWG
jgi:hypothetical protein